MARTRRHSSTAAVAAAALAIATLVAVPGTAQTVTDGGSADAVLDVSLETLAPERSEIAEAAVELETAAGLLAADDPSRAEDLRLAARYYHHAGQLEKARVALVAAGRAFFARGDHVIAAHTFIDASQAAAEDGNTLGAWSAAHMAGAVLREGDVRPEDREAVLDRVRFVERELSLTERGLGS